jgi:hypothetical protein
MDGGLEKPSVKQHPAAIRMLFDGCPIVFGKHSGALLGDFPER